MKVRLNIPLRNLNGEEIVDDKGNSMSLKIPCIEALLATTEEVKSMTGIQKMERYNLATRLYENGNIELKPEEISLIRDVVGKNCPIVVMGQIFEATE